MTPTSFPAAAYGKAADRRDEYGVLWTQQGFTDAAQQSLRKLARAYQFLGDRDGGDTCYPDCFVLWPVEVGGGWLAARLRDAGRDSLSRPHTLRIDAVFIAPSLSQDNRTGLLGFLEAGAWPSESFEDSHSAFTSFPAAASPTVSRALEGIDLTTSTPTILRAFHNQGTNTRFELVLDTEGIPVSARAPAISSPHNDSASTTQHGGSATTSRTMADRRESTVQPQHGGLLRLLTTSGLALAIGMIGGIFWHKAQSEPVIRDLNAELVRQEQQHERELAERQRKAQEDYDSLLSQTRHLQETEDSFRALAREYGFTNVADLESALIKLGLSTRSADPRESRIQRLQRLYESLGTEIFSPATPPQPASAPQQPR
jgi:hypothetical protein